MEASTFKKRLLRHIGNTNPTVYLTPSAAKTQLKYPQKCCLEPSRKNYPIVSLDCQMVITDLGSEAVRIVVVDQQFKPILQQFFRPKGKIIDYVTAITGFTQEHFEGVNLTLQDIRPTLLELIHEKIIVGHDLVNDLNALGVIHQEFIDTVNLFPHTQGLPLKPKLKDLAMKILKTPIQYGVHDPLQDAVAALRLVKQHIQGGRGLEELVEDVPQTPFGLENICTVAQLDPNKVILLIMRGSRAGGFEEKTSDYDYVMVYNTNSIINGGLIKLYNLDITFFDKRSFEVLINDQDISIFEIFFNGKQNQLRNPVVLPQLNLMKLRQSTTLHVYKSLNKSRRFLRSQNFKKSLKCIHMAYRFYDYYDQFANFGTIKDHRRIVPLWLEMRSQYYNNKHNPYYLHSKYLQKLQQYASQFRKRYPTIKRFHDEVGQPRKTRIAVRLGKLNKKYDQSDLQQGDLNVLHYLRENGDKYLEYDYRVRIAEHIKYTNIIQLHYLQSANFAYAITRESRGLILDQKQNYKIIAFPYFKFFDYNDKNCNLLKFCWEKSQIFYKLDGSTATLYYYDKQWHVASSTRPDGAGQYCFAQEAKITTFSEQFWRIFYANQYKLPSEQDQDKTFIFEMLSTRHLIVVNHQKDRLVMHGVRHTPSLREINLDQYRGKYGWQIIKPLQIKYKCIQDVVAQAEKLDPREHEGFILKDCNNMRVKVKSTKYLLLSLSNPLNNNLITDRTLLDLIVTNQHLVFAQYCPQWSSAIESLYNRLQKVRQYIFHQINLQGKTTTMKDFAIKVKQQDYLLRPLFFSARKGEITPDNFYQNVPIKRLGALLQLKIPQYEPEIIQSSVKMEVQPSQ